MMNGCETEDDVIFCVYFSSLKRDCQWLSEETRRFFIFRKQFSALLEQMLDGRDVFVVKGELCFAHLVRVLLVVLFQHAEADFC